MSAKLWARAEQLAREIKVVELGPGVHEITWVRPHSAFMGEVVTHQAATPLEALIQMICIEEEFQLRKAHGECCPCEDCCIARVDQCRRERRRV